MLLRQEIAFHEYWRENTFRNFSIPFAENTETMPSNKNAVIRYKYLDEMLSDATR